MAQGRPTQTLTAGQIERLENFRRAARMTFSMLAARMETPFGFEVLKRAIEGRPVWNLNHDYIAAWIEANLDPSGMQAMVSEGDRSNAKL